MTNRYGGELGITDRIDPEDEPAGGLAPAAITWPEFLQGFGYTMMLAGKWHLGTRDEFHPTRDQSHSRRGVTTEGRSLRHLRPGVKIR
jgi:arylsulfatase A-like enzyme